MSELLVRGGDVITMNAAREILADSAVLVRDGVIAEIGPFTDLRRRYPDVDTIGGPDDIVTPGYVNAHQHLTGDRLIRSAIPDNIDSQEAIFGWAVPIHGAHTGDDDELSATLSLVEAVTNGITTTVEAGTVAHPDRVVAAMHAVGVRGTIGRWGWDVDDAPWAAPVDEVLDAAAALVGTYPPIARGGGLVEGWVTLVGHDLMSDELVAGASDLARSLGTNLTFHLSPHGGDAVSYLARTGLRPAVHLDRLGVLGPHVLLAHAVHLDDEELEVVIERGTAVAACPWAYLRLAQGLLGAGRHLDLFRRGGRVALGCDAENAGDAIDVLRAATLFVGVERDRVLDPTAITAHDGLALATVLGAAAIGMGDRVGSIEIGKQGDLVVHDTTGPQWVPRSPDPVLQLMWASDGRSVRDVVIAGRPVVRSGRCVTVDVESLRDEAAARSRRLLGVRVRP